MDLSPTITVSGDLAEKLQQLASLRQQNINVLLETLLNQAWLQEEEVDTQAANDDIPSPEMQAYIMLHPTLKEQHLGEYVAVYQGNLIDHDSNREALYKRIDAQYPNEFVWISLVEEEAIPTLAFRSPRIERNGRS